MQTFIHTRPSESLTFVNLKTFIKDHFEQIPYILKVEDVDYIKNMKTQTYAGVFADSRIIDGNLRVLDTHMPEYLLFIITNSENNISIRQAITQAAKIGLPHYTYDFQLLLFEIKMFNFIEAIIASNFSSDIWHGQWQRDNCYVIKHNGELEYYTVYDYRRLARCLLDWLNITAEKIVRNNVQAYRLYMSVNI